MWLGLLTSYSKLTDLNWFFFFLNKWGGSVQTQCIFLMSADFYFFFFCEKDFFISAPSKITYANIVPPRTYLWSLASGLLAAINCNFQWNRLPLLFWNGKLWFFQPILIRTHHIQMFWHCPSCPTLMLNVPFDVPPDAKSLPHKELRPTRPVVMHRINVTFVRFDHKIWYFYALEKITPSWV